LRKRKEEEFEILPPLCDFFCDSGPNNRKELFILEFWGDLLDDNKEKEEKDTTRDQEIRDQTNTKQEEERRRR